MPKFLIHTISTFNLMSVVEADTAEKAELKAANHTYDEYQRHDVDEVISISEVPDDYNLHKDAHSKGYI